MLYMTLSLEGCVIDPMLIGNGFPEIRPFICNVVEGSRGGPRGILGVITRDFGHRVVATGRIAFHRIVHSSWYPIFQ